MDAKQTDLKRRRFLLAAGAGSAAAAALVARGGREAPPAPTPVAGAEAKSGGYTETGHVRNYYRTTRI